MCSCIVCQDAVAVLKEGLTTCPTGSGGWLPSDEQKRPSSVLPLVCLGDNYVPAPSHFANTRDLYVQKAPQMSRACETFCGASSGSNDSK